MRLDKFLKISRIIKRRSVAKEICEHGRVQINGRIAKAGHDVEVGDVLKIDLGRRIITVEVLETPATISAHMAQELYRVMENTEKEEQPW